MTQPNLVLLPWARRGGAVTLPPDDPSGHPASQVSATAEVVVNGASPPASVPVQLLGPGDVTGLAPQQVIRTDPAPGARTFESNYLALVEFDEPALPWLFGSSRGGSPSLSGLISTLVPTLIIAVAYFAIFLLLRTRFPRQYAPRTYLGALRPQERTPTPPNTLFGWIPFMRKV